MASRIASSMGFLPLITSFRETIIMLPFLREIKVN
jgi:hypothetical protein